MKKNKLNILKEMKYISKKMNKKKSLIVSDMIVCKLKYQASFQDYFRFEMFRLNKYERKTIITTGINKEFILKYNNPKYIDTFQNRSEFYKTFSKYINRDWLEIKENKKNEFAIFCLNHSEIFVKTLNAESNVNKVKVSDYKLKELYEELIENKQFLIEEVIKPHKKISKIYPYCVSTVRVTTLLGQVVDAYFKIGSTNNITDSFEQGGLIVPIDITDGKIKLPAINQKRKIYKQHPITEKDIIGFEMPHWQEVKKECEEAALEIPQVGYVSWDIAIGQDAHHMLEASAFPKHDLYGLPKYQNNNVGLLPVFKKAEEREIEE